LEDEDSDRSAQLMRIGISGSPDIYPQLLFELLRAERCPKSLIEASKPLIARIDRDKIRLPERFDVDRLFEFSCLWSPAVLQNQRVIEYLREPPLSAAVRLSSCLCEEEAENLFAKFPHAFAAIICHLPGPFHPPLLSVSMKRLMYLKRKKELLEMLQFS